MGYVIREAGCNQIHFCSCQCASSLLEGLCHRVDFVKQQIASSLNNIFIHYTTENDLVWTEKQTGTVQYANWNFNHFKYNYGATRSNNYTTI